MAQESTKAEKLVDGYGLIEGPVWVADRGLVFSDVIHGGVYCLSKSSDVSTVFEHRRGIGGMSFHVDGGMIVSGRNLAFKSFDGERNEVLLDSDPSSGRVGFNDITTDSLGRIYAGSLGSSPVFEDGLEPRAGDLFLIELDGNARKVANDVELTNGLAFSPDGRRLYHADSKRNTVFSYAVNDDGSLGPKTPFALTDQGMPDGLVVSEDGAVWVALAGGSGVAVYDQAGRAQRLIEIAEPMCTSVCFGGEDLRSLYIVSGSDGAASDRSGAIYRLDCEIAGQAVPPARVSY